MLLQLMVKMMEREGGEIYGPREDAYGKNKVMGEENVRTWREARGKEIIRRRKMRELKKV
jgi:hypothetical protein